MAGKPSFLQSGNLLFIKIPIVTRAGFLRLDYFLNRRLKVMQTSNRLGLGAVEPGDILSTTAHQDALFDVPEFHALAEPLFCEFAVQRRESGTHATL